MAPEGWDQPGRPRLQKVGGGTEEAWEASARPTSDKPMHKHFI